MDLREGSIYYYSDIPTFLEYIELNCQPEVCENIIDILITSYMLSGTILQQPIAYINTKLMLSGWIILKEVAEFSTLESVLFRATLRYSYFQDKYQGDKTMYWKYIQSSLNENINGYQITTYHNNQSESLNTYKTQESNSWLSLNSYYYEALTFWHWLVYQEGVDEANNIRLSIYFGHGKQEKTFTMNAKLYFNIIGDNQNQKFNGSNSGLTLRGYDTQKIACNPILKSKIYSIEFTLTLGILFQKNISRTSLKVPQIKTNYIINEFMFERCYPTQQEREIRKHEYDVLENQNLMKYGGIMGLKVSFNGHLAFYDGLQFRQEINSYGFYYAVKISEIQTDYFFGNPVMILIWSLNCYIKQI